MARDASEGRTRGLTRDREQVVSSVPAGVAGHHPDTVAAGVEVLEEGGSAADAAVAATFASCVAETTMTGLGGGGHGIHFDAATGQVELFDFFVAVPGLAGGNPDAEHVMVDMLFEDEAVPYAIGAGSVGVPGVAAGCGAIAARHGTLPWPLLLEPAIALARRGTVLPPTHARVLEMLAPAMTLNEGAAVYAPGGRLIEPDGTLHQPDLVNAFETLQSEGARSFFDGTLASSMLSLLTERGSTMTRADLDAYEVLSAQPQQVTVEGATVWGRRDLAGALDALDRLPDLRGLDEAARAPAVAAALDGIQGRGDTTNVTAVDPAGNACVMTTSLGLGSSDWLPGFGVHLNSMLGERDLITGPLIAGERLGSMMCPIVAVDGDGLAAAAGAAGGSRIRSALVQVLSGVLAEGVDVVDAVSRPRLHPDGRLVHVEPDYPAEGVEALRQAGYIARMWRTRHHFFGGVGVIGRRGACGEPRRDGAARLLGHPT